MDTILERVYQEPAQVARIRQQRERRKTKPPSMEVDKKSDDADDWPAEPPF